MNQPWAEHAAMGRRWSKNGQGSGSGGGGGGSGGALGAADWGDGQDTQASFESEKFEEFCASPDVDM